jgi:hypothetical protein
MTSQYQASPYHTTQEYQSPAYTPSAVQNPINQNAYSVALIEKPCLLYFVEYVPNQPIPTLQGGPQLQPIEPRFIHATSTTGIPNSTFQY